MLLEHGDGVAAGGISDGVIEAGTQEGELVKAVYLDLLIATALVCLWEPRLLVVFGLTVVGHRYIRKLVESKTRQVVYIDTPGGVVQLEDRREESAGAMPVSMILWGALALVGVGFYAYEPAPLTTAPEVPGAVAAAPDVAPPQAPPGMIYDKEHNSFHYPPVPNQVRHP